MTNLRRVAALIAIGLTTSAAARGQDALATVYDETSRVLAEAHFESTGDSFAVTKRADVEGRPYLEYRYVRKDGTQRAGVHRGSATVGETVRFDHDFGEGRTVTFRVCVLDSCSGTELGENWTVGHA